MSETRSLFQLLAQGRFRLNSIMLTAKFLTWSTWTGAVSGGIFLTIRLLGWSGMIVPIWASVSLSGGLIGLCLGWRRRLSNRAVAGWLDEQLKSGEVLSAALVCVERGCSGPFDRRILDAADQISRRSNEINWPFRYLLKRACFFTTVIVLFMGLIYLSPLSQRNRGPAFLKTAVKEKSGTESRRSKERLVVESPRAIAKMLFPEDLRMAMLAERALREGDLPVLQDLLKEAQLNMERKMPGGVKPEEQHNLQNEVERRRQLMESLIAKSEAENQADSGSQGRKKSDSSKPVIGKKGAGDRRRGGSLAQGKGSGNGQSLPQGSRTNGFKPSDYIPGGGSGVGTGHNSNKGSWGKVAARTGKAEKIFSQNKKSQILEYVLPGKNAGLPLTQVIPESQKSAEAALYREGIPYEYEEFVRNYFLLLSEETKGKAIKEAQK